MGVVLLCVFVYFVTVCASACVVWEFGDGWAAGAEHSPSFSVLVLIFASKLCLDVSMDRGSLFVCSCLRWAVWWLLASFSSKSELCFEWAVASVFHACGMWVMRGDGKIVGQAGICTQIKY